MTRDDAIGVMVAIAALILIGLVSQLPKHKTQPPAPTGQTFCVVEPGYPAVLCAIVDVKGV